MTNVLDAAAVFDVIRPIVLVLISGALVASGFDLFRELTS